MGEMMSRAGMNKAVETGCKGALAPTLEFKSKALYLDEGDFRGCGVQMPTYENMKNYL